ncbi:hypothetical protein [Streptomyces sp. P17]|uniref:hypothetical protein n=1 Tax=Streptomyces sp. P17 TaxID=3074716 RepID=UPI0028F44FAF|nr:hypothetical protein [Streptomyces sp. P17]
MAEVAWRRWGVALGGPFPARFSEPAWSYEERVGHRCPVCEGELHSLRRPYESQGRVYRYTALVCPACPTAFTLADVGAKTYDQLTAVPSMPAPVPMGSCPSGAGATVTAIRVPGQFPAAVREGRRPAWPEDLAVPEQAEKRALLWCKVTDPAWRPAEEVLAEADDVRVSLPEGPEYDTLRTWLREHDVPYRVSRYWEEAEQVGTVNESGGRTDLVAVGPGDAVPAAGPWAAAARDAFTAQ